MTDLEKLVELKKAADAARDVAESRRRQDRATRTTEDEVAIDLADRWWDKATSAYSVALHKLAFKIDAPEVLEAPKPDPKPFADDWNPLHATPPGMRPRPSRE